MGFRELHHRLHMVLRHRWSRDIETITEVGSPNSVVTENITKRIKMKTQQSEWKMNKKYSYTITFSLDEIYWAPSVDKWSDGI